MDMDENTKILSWNINGLRSQRSNFKQFLDDLQAHIICFQETKITRDQLEENLAVVDGYVSFFSFSRKRSGYSGVATYCRKEATPSFAQEGLSGVLNIGSLSDEAGKEQFLSSTWDAKDLKDLDAEGRCIITQHPYKNARGERKLLSIVNVYCPRADPERPERALFKLSFYELLKQRAALLRDSGSSVVILGDLNTSHRKIDHCDPCEDEFEKRDDRVFLDRFLVDSSAKTQTDKSSTLINEGLPYGNSEEHGEESEAYEAFKVVDTYRHFYPDKKEAFTCWNTKVNARSTNYGTRIDYVLCDEDFVEHVKDAVIQQDILGSDHCPVLIEVTGVKFLSAHVLPEISTKFYPEFQGSQQKLLSYFKPNSRANEVKPDSAAQQTSGCHSAGSAKRKMIDKCPGTKNKKIIGTTQSTISSYFIKNSEDLTSTESISRNTLSGTDLCDEIIEDDCSKFSEKRLKVIDDCNKSLYNKSCDWGFMMKGPAPPPVCSGHKEPSVLRTVKKKGPTWNKQFYSCARGVGKETDPNSRCNFFQWFKHGR